MYVDSRLEFSVAQALTATADSTNVIDLSADTDVGAGEPLWLVLQVDVATDFTTGDETYTIVLETDDNAAMTSSEVLLSFTLVGAVAAGTRVVHAVPFTNQRFLQVLYTLAGTTPTATLSAWLTGEDPTHWAAQADASN